MKRILTIGLVWAGLWMAAATILGVIIAVIDPASIDPGEEYMGLVIFGLMGFLSGAAFALLLSIGRAGRQDADRPVAVVAIWGLAGTAVAQVPYLGHGDQGLLANIGMALVFSAFGGCVAMLWQVLARARRLRLA